jgi:hypothetical protein
VSRIGETFLTNNERDNSMTDSILPIRRRKPLVPRFPRTLGDSDWLLKKLREANSPENEQFRRDYLGQWTVQPADKEKPDGPDRQTDRQL